MCKMKVGQNLSNLNFIFESIVIMVFFKIFAFGIFDFFCNLHIPPKET